MDLQRCLNELGYAAPDARGVWRALVVDGDYGPRTEEAVADFEEHEGLLADGVTGAVTLRAIEDELAVQTNMRFSSRFNGAGEASLRHRFRRMPADRFHGHGYETVALRDDVATAYGEVYKTVHQHGGRMTSSGGIRDLFARINSGRSAMSMHYLGRAFDLGVRSGMVNPSEDAYVVTRDQDEDSRMVWRVWARCSSQRAETAGGSAPATRVLEDPVTYDAPHGNRKPTRGRFLDLTALLEKHGFRGIGARPGFAQGGNWLRAEWWHFQWEKGMERAKTTFGDELLAIYPRSTLEDSPPWRFREHIFGEDWC
ncbi:MAG: peptidoglycan-binding protein [bacterium]|nr:peptidoglycan-binding protein [bacterium]